MNIHHFTPEEIEKLGSYVYLYTDPRNGKPFYIGKGKGNRAFHHLNDPSESRKVKRIEEIKASGSFPKIEILVHGLDDVTAKKVEAAAIDLIGFENLTNGQKGHHSQVYGRRSIEAVHAELSEEPISEFVDDVILIKLNRSFLDSSDKSALELYDATRGCWKLNRSNAKKAGYAAAVYGGVIREVYKIAEWFPAETTQYFDPGRKDAPSDRWEFVGKIADLKTRKRYRWKSVRHLFSKGASNPIMYVGPSFPKGLAEPLSASDGSD